MRLFLIAMSIVALAPSCPEKSPEYYYEQGMREASRTGYEEAVKYYSKAIAKHPQYLEAYLARASAWEQLDSMHRSIEDMNMVLSFPINNVEKRGEYVFLLANAYYLNSQDSLACKYWKDACEYNHNRACDLFRRKCK